MDWQGKRSLRPHLLSALFVLVATGLTVAAEPLFNGRAPVSFFLLAVLLSASRGGLRTGLLVTAVSLAIMFGFFGNNVVVPAVEYPSAALFTVAGVVASVILDRFRRKNQALAETQRELEAVNRKLLDHAELLAEANARLAEQARALQASGS